MSENDLRLLKAEFRDKWNYPIKNLAFPCEYFNSLGNYQKPVNGLKKTKLFR